MLQTLPADLPPEKVYADQTASYASNEIAINWQATLVFPAGRASSDNERRGSSASTQAPVED